MNVVAGGVTNAAGFKATGFFAGVRKKRNDVAIIYSDVPAEVAGVFTKSTVKAAPVLWDMDIVSSGNKVRAIVVNSGNANACTGDQGVEDAEKMAEAMAKAYGIEKKEVLVSSTGVIGVPLPVEKILSGIESNHHKIGDSREDSQLAAEAIMTTDTFSKWVAVETEIDGKTVNIGGIAKGSGMIHPNMGTMLGYLTTDANISKEMLRKALQESTVDSYNMISVDGDTSTNDTVLLLANGTAKNKKIESESEDYEKFKEALHFVNLNLAQQIVKDGEGAGKFLAVNVSGTKKKDDARKFAMSIINSSLVKTAFFGEDANWGRMVAAMGYTEIEFDLAKTSIYFKSDGGRVDLMKNGVPIEFSEEEAKKVLKATEIDVMISLGEGSEEATAWGCDLSYDYVKINADYRT